MKNYLLLLSLVFITGCAGLSPERTFPEPPTNLKPCPELLLVKEGAKLSDVLTVVVDNYSLYHECRISVDAWNEWYSKQKKIQDEIDK